MTVKEREPQGQEKIFGLLPSKIKTVKTYLCNLYESDWENECLPLLQQNMKLSSVG